MKEWILKNKVVIIGLLSACLLAVSELVKGGNASVQVLIFSGLIAGASWVARNLRGQWATIIGIFGNALAAYLTQQETGNVSYAQLLLQFIVSLLAVIAAPAKSIGYEQSATITEAIKEGEVIQPTMASETATKPPA